LLGGFFSLSTLVRITYQSNKLISFSFIGIQIKNQHLSMKLFVTLM